MAPRHVSEELLRTAVDAAPDGIVVVNASGTIQFANPMLDQLFGYGAGELLGQSVEVLLPEALRGAHVGLRKGYMQHPRPRPMGSGLDLRGRRRSGEEFPVEVSLSAVREGEERYVIAIVRDVTERRAAADELIRVHEQLALVDDRERIARDLHDTVIQRLFAVGLSLQGALIHLTDPAAVERVDTAVDEIDGTIRDIRTAIFSLHARRVSGASARDEVLATAREAGRALGFEPHVVFAGPVDAATPDDVRAQLVPALREALSNVVKHAQATMASVRVEVDGDDLVMVVADNGVGFGDQTHGGRGVGNMVERAEAVHGSCRIRPAKDGGTEVEWRVPVGIAGDLTDP